MSLVFQFYTDDDSLEVETRDLLARFTADGLHARAANDGFDHWIEFDETNTLIFLNSETGRFSSGRVEMSLVVMAEDVARIIGPLRDFGFSISDEDGEI